MRGRDALPTTSRASQRRHTTICTFERLGKAAFENLARRGLTCSGLAASAFEVSFRPAYRIKGLRPAVAPFQSRGSLVFRAFPSWNRNMRASCQAPLCLFG